MNSWLKNSTKLLTALLVTVTIVLALSACSGPAGASVTGATIDSSGHLIMTLSDGKTIDAGVAAGPPVTTTVLPTTNALTMGDLFTLTRPVIVRVGVTGQGFNASGSGIIFRNDGYLVTNQHVIDGAESITITLSNDQKIPATISSSDANLDLAILKLTSPPSDLTAANLGSASDIAIGGVVIAAGFPLGSTLPGPASFTQGIVSAIRNLDGQNYVQTDVAISPGSSGGALLNRSNGRVIGITSAAILPPRVPVEGIGLAIPIDVVQKYIQDNLK
jgi:S1-C subfamily serine protease